jgi:HSP20 family protein
LSFDDDFNDFFDDFDIFKMLKRSQSEMEKMLEKIRSGDIEGTWEIRQIDEPNMKGFAVRGRFGTEEPLQPLEPIDPLKPSKRRPLPEKPFEVPKAALQEMRDPLVDIFDEDSAVKVYVELPGVEKEDIKLDFGKGCIEVRARNFYKTIELPNRQVCMKNPAIQYRNGVLEITLQKNKKLREEDAKNLKIV